MQLMRDSRPIPLRLAALAALSVALLAGSLAFGAGVLTTGAQSGSGGEIHGCVNGYTGALRILNGSQQCSAGERPLSWSRVPAGTVLDRKMLEERVILRTDDKRSSVEGFVACPDGYLAATGGALPIYAGGADVFSLYASTPEYTLTGHPRGWSATFHTVDGKEAVGYYEFSVSAVCELRST